MRLLFKANISLDSEEVVEFEIKKEFNLLIFLDEKTEAHNHTAS